VRSSAVRRGLVVAAAVLAVVGCAPTWKLPGPVATACGTPSYSCALPYPAQRYQVSDPTTATGVRVQVPEATFPAAVIGQLGPGGTLADAERGADGFSPLGPVVFQFPDGVDPTSVPSDGGDVITVTDLDTGARVPLRAEVAPTTDERGRRGVLVLWPRTTWPYGAEVRAAVGPGLRSAEGAAAMPWVAETSFTVRSLASITDDVDRMAAAVRADEHPVRNLLVSPPVMGGAAIVTGQVASTDFRDDRGVVPNDGSAQGRRRWLDFLVTLPDRPAGPAGAPVVIYGHGISTTKESALIVAARNAERGVATIGIDVPNHGSRAYEDGPLFEIIYPTHLGQVTTMTMQGELDHLSLLMAVQSSLRDLDAVPFRSSTDHGDGVADLDVSRVFYQGTSMGGFLGTTFVGLAPEIDGAFVQVPGAGILDTIYHSLLWGIFDDLLPAGAGPGDGMALIAGAQALLDRSDPTHYLDRIRRRGTPFFVVYGVGDGVVINETTDRLVELLDLPSVGPRYRDAQRSTLATLPSDGRAVQQVPTEASTGALGADFFAHLAFAHPDAWAAYDAWMDQQVAPRR